LHWVLLPSRTHNRTLIFSNIPLEHGIHFDYWNQPLNTRMSVCYLHFLFRKKNSCTYKNGLGNAHPALHLDCHEVGLCCYLVIQIENLLRPLQPFYFHLWPIYWLSFVVWEVLILFNIYINYILSNTDRIRFLKFADNTCILAQGFNPKVSRN
jgi:hypothetical protein